jgi:hypothetical protein
MGPKSLLGVLTGDIVESREISIENRRLLYADLKAFLARLKKEKWITEFELFRGDSFQCVLEQPENLLRAALLIRTFIKGYLPRDEKDRLEKSVASGAAPTKGYLPGDQDIRLAMGIGPVDFYDPKSLAHSDGDAFRFSGEELDNLKKAPYRMALRTQNKGFNEPMEPAILLLDAVLQKWTNNQAETILYKLEHFKEEDISKALNISQPAVNQRIKAAQWFAVEMLLTYFEKTIKDWKE